MKIEQRLLKAILQTVRPESLKHGFRSSGMREPPGMLYVGATHDLMYLH
jgi:hypothetical protein